MWIALTKSFQDLVSSLNAEAMYLDLSDLFQNGSRRFFRSIDKSSTRKNHLQNTGTAFIKIKR